MQPTVHSPLVERVPIVASIPHGGESVPPEIQAKLLVEMERNYADWYTPHLWSFLPSVGIATVVATAHRLVADVNRNPESGAAPWPTGAIATTSTRSEPMYEKPISVEEVADRIGSVHVPYHQALDLLVEEALSQFDSAILLDLHSFGWPLEVDVVLGDKGGRTAPPEVVEGLEESFRRHDFTVARNRPYSGGWIIERFVDEARVHAVQVELNQRLYLDPKEIDVEDWKRPSMDEGRLAEASNRLVSVMTEFSQLSLT